MPKIFILMGTDVFLIIRFFIRPNAAIASRPGATFLSTKLYGYLQPDRFTQNLEQIHLTQGE